MSAYLVGSAGSTQPLTDTLTGRLTLGALGVYSEPLRDLRERKVRTLVWKETRRWHYPQAHELPSTT